VTDGTGDGAVAVDVGIEPAPIAKTVSVSLGVGDIVTFDGVSN